MDGMSGMIVADMTEGAIAPSVTLSLDDAHVYRSKIVEKCVEAERHILRLLAAKQLTWSPKAPLSQKIECLKEAYGKEPSNKRTRATLALLAELGSLSDTRSELVHSTMSISKLEGAQVCVLRNAAEQDNSYGVRSILSVDRFKAILKQLSNVANRLGQVPLG